MVAEDTEDGSPTPADLRLAMSRMQRFRSIFSEFGLVTGLMYLTALMFRRFLPFFSVEKYFVVAQPVATSALLPERRGQNISVHVIKTDHPLLASLPRPREELARRFSGGAVCFLAMRDEQIVGYLWVTQSPYREPVHRCEFDPCPSRQIAWDFDMWIQPDERLGLAFVRMWDRCNSYLRERGVTWTCSRVSAFNSASLRSHARLGMRVMHTLTYLTAGSLELLVADVAPFLALSVRRFPNIALVAPLVR